MLRERVYSPGSKKKSTSSVELMNIILRDSALLAAFDKFCIQNHAEENLHFYMDVEAFKLYEDPKIRIDTAVTIYEKYIEVGYHLGDIITKSD